jgi:hypothetical protein
MDEIDFKSVYYIGEVIYEIGLSNGRATGSAGYVYRFSVADCYGRHDFWFNSFDEAFIERKNFCNHLMGVVSGES